MTLRDKLLPGTRLGFGTAPLGNMFRAIPEAEAAATIRSAWEHGTRYFDTAPFYGAGLAELRLGASLPTQRRDSFVVSTKVGRIILDEVEDPAAREQGEKAGVFAAGRPNKIRLDYSAAGTRSSIEGSLERLGISRIDIVWVHDVAQDFHGDEWLARFEEARRGAFRELSRLRDQGVIKAWGLGVNKTEPCELLLDLKEFRPDGFLLAGRYTLLDHSHALQRLMPAALRHGADIIVGGPYSSGILAGGTTFEYQDAPPAILAKVGRIHEIASRHGVSLKAAALQFSLAHPAVAAVIPGASRPDRIAEDHAALAQAIPGDFWEELRHDELVDPLAPLPID